MAWICWSWQSTPQPVRLRSIIIWMVGQICLNNPLILRLDSFIWVHYSFPASSWVTLETILPLLKKDQLVVIRPRWHLFPCHYPLRPLVPSMFSLGNNVDELKHFLLVINSNQVFTKCVPSVTAYLQSYGVMAFSYIDDWCLLDVCVGFYIPQVHN